MSRNLVVHYSVSYLIKPTKEALKLGGRKVSVHEWHDGRVEVRCGGVTLPYASVDNEPQVSPGEVVENKRLGAVLATIQAAQTKRDEARLASPKMTVVKKDRLRARRQRLREDAPALSLITGDTFPATSLRLLGGESLEERLHRSVGVDAGERDTRRPGDLRWSARSRLPGRLQARARARCRRGTLGTCPQSETT